MNKPPAASRIIELLESLKSAVEKFVARAEKLATESRTQLTRERQRHENALSELTRNIAVQQGELDTGFQAAKTALEEKSTARAAWIGRAYQTSKEQQLQRIEDRVGARKYEMQKTVLNGEKQRERDLADAASRVQDFQSRLAEQEQRLGELERKARKLLRGLGRLRAGLSGASSDAEIDANADEDQLLGRLKSLLEQVSGEENRLRGNLPLHLFKHVALWLVLALLPVAAVPFAAQLGWPNWTFGMAGAVAAGIFVLALLVRFALVRGAAPRASALVKALGQARRFHDAAAEKAQTRYQRDVQAAHVQYQEAISTSDQRLKQAVSEASQQRVSVRMTADEKTVRITARNDRMLKERRQRLEANYQQKRQALSRTTDASREALVSRFGQIEQRIGADQEVAWSSLEKEWNSFLTPIFSELQAARASAAELFPPWTADFIKRWSPPPNFAQSAKLATLGVDIAALCDAMPKDKRLALPGPTNLDIPVCLDYPAQGSVVLETSASGHDAAIDALNNTILRLLTVAPPGRLNFTIIDPVGLGQNFAGIMHLADYEEQLINSRIWTQSGQIEQKLADLNEHMEKVIQMYLRNEYATIAEYNEQAGVIAEKFYYVVVADFPTNFTDLAARRLLSIAASGARCGVYLLLHWDRRQPLPQDFLPDELRKGALCLTMRGQEFVVLSKALPGTTLRLDTPPRPEAAIELVQRIGEFSRDSSRVEVPFQHVAPADEEMWSLDTTSELRVPIGRTGATKLQYLAIGKGTCQHGLVAGKTGSGKSTLFHVIITNLAVWCSPEQVEFYLVDFKKGVEFKCYASNRLPHARVVAIESDREFGLSVLQKVDDELRRRGDLFRSLGVQDIPGYKRAGGTESLPRCLLMIDEFQEFFVEDDKIAQTASLLLDRIVRQGRAFGIHVLLGSQTLGGAYTVARTTLGQMVIRIALQTNEADAYLIMDDNNPAPRLLSRPGEGIYNDTAGTVEGNSPFQVVWLPDNVRDSYLRKARAHADQKPGVYSGPIVFEGNVPADVGENGELRQALEMSAPEPAVPRIWLGAPNSIKGPTQAAFQKQSGNNLLIVGQRDETILGMISLALVSLAAQYPGEGTEIVFLDASPPGTPARDYLDRVLRLIPRPITVAKPGDVPEVFARLGSMVKERADEPDALHSNRVFLVINGLQRFSRLRFEEDFGFSGSESEAPPNPGAVLNTIVTEATRLGFHVIATCDTYNNVNRFLSRKAFSEFEMRVLFQMSANDSASLIDNPKASTLGLHRALFFNAQEGYLETFRPYALPTSNWLERAGGLLATKSGKTPAQH